MEFIQQNMILVAVAVVSGFLLIFRSISGAGGAKGLSTTAATTLINRENAQVIDVREADEYAAGHLPDARSIPLGQLEGRAGELDKLKETPLIVVCQSGTRSPGACKQLAKLGFTKVHSLEGGISGWRAAGLPLKKGSKK